jgi:hypothetical protein
MTYRSVILGLLCAATLCAVTFFNDQVLHGSYLVGNFMPIAVFGTLILFLLLINPLLALLSKRLALSGRELAVIVALTFFCCYIAGRGFMHFFTTFLMLPHHHERTTTSWQGDPAQIEIEDIRDWGALISALSGEGGEPGPVEEIRRRLPADAVDRIAAVDDIKAPPLEMQLELTTALNAVLKDRELCVALASQQPDVPSHISRLIRIGPDELSDIEIERINRGLFEQAFAGMVSERRTGVLEKVPPQMLADPRENPSEVLDGFVTGLASGEETIGVRDVPWYAWRRTMLFWMPLILSMCVAVIGLSLVIHRQWFSHEHLPYPVVEFAKALLPAEGQAGSAISRNRLFWVGMLSIMTIHMNNYACAWWPEYLIPIKLSVDFSPILDIFPVFKKGPWWVFRPNILFTAVAFAYFLATDVSLSLGIAPYFYCLIAGFFAGYGIGFWDWHLKPTTPCCLYAGAYIAMFLVLFYTGRQYYGSVLRSSLFLPAKDKVERHAVIGARIFFLASALFVVQLVIVGVQWQMAVLYTLGMIIIFVVLSRLLAEAGAFFLHSWWYPCALLWAFFGEKAVGPDQLLVLAMVSSVLLIDPREALMPFVASGLCLVDRTRGRIGALAAWGVVALIIGFAVGIPVSLYLQYRHGAFQVGDGWTCWGVPKFAFDHNSEISRILEAQGSLEVANSLSGWQRFIEAAPAAPAVIAFSTTFLLVLLFTFLRRRFSKWPIHPLLFLVLGTHQSVMLGFSFLLGCTVKTSVTKYGGASLYRKLKPLMIGIIAGDMVSSVIPVIIGAVYHFVTGNQPPWFRVFIG